MKPAKKASSVSKKYPPGSFMYKVRKRRIIETLAAFIGGGWLTWEAVHWILVEHYHCPEKLLDITLITLIGALLCTLIWRWFGGIKKQRKIKVELIFILLVILIAAFFNIRLIQQIREPEAGSISKTRWKNSIAVLPFANISADEEQEYFCDGLTEELINRLSNIRELKVPARTSIFAFKGEKIDIREIGEKLNVETVLEGSVRKAGNQLRVTAQLINIADGYHLWSQKFDRNIDDIFAIQDEISLAIADKLKIELLGEEAGRLMKRPTENLAAYNLYLRGRFFFHNGTEENMKKSIGLFEQAIDEDPNYALAYAALANSYSVLSWNTYLSPREGYSKAKSAAMKALELDDGLGEAHASLAFIKFIFDWDFAEAELEFQRALELSPGSAEVYVWRSSFLTLMGRFDEAIAGIKYAIELDPISPMINFQLGYAYHVARRFDESINEINKMLELHPNFVWAYVVLFYNYAVKEMYPEALVQIEKAKALGFSEDDQMLLGELGWCYGRMGRREDALKLLDRLMDLSINRDVDAYYVAIVYAGLGEKDKAFEWLDKGYQERSPSMTFLKTDTFFYPSLGSDPRFNALIKKIGFEK